MSPRLFSFLFLSVLCLLGEASSVSASGGVEAATSFQPHIASGTPEPAQLGNGLIVGAFVLGTVSTGMGLLAHFRPQPALHKQFADREEYKEGQREIRIAIKEVAEKLEQLDDNHYSHRGLMDQRINRLENAWNFWAGKMAGEKDPDAQELKSILGQRLSARD